MIATIATHNLFSRSFNMLTFLHESQFTFHLTGSRFFGMSESNSDYDFITEDSLEVHDFLTREGFMPVENVYSDDKLTSCVYRLMPIRLKVHAWVDALGDYDYIDNGTGAILPGNEGFDIQVTKYLDYKLLVQRILQEKYPDGLGLDKIAKANLWKLVLFTLQSVGIIPKNID